jgi:hypothetical protein
MSESTGDTNENQQEVSGEGVSSLTTPTELETAIKEVAPQAIEGNLDLELKDYDPRPQHDAARRYIAYWLLALLTTLIVCTFGGFVLFICLSATKPTFTDFKSLVELVLTPLLTLVSAATGFYFGSQHSKSSAK